MALQGKIAIITGAGCGIGHATAIKFANSGIKVVVNDIIDDSAVKTVNEIKSNGGEAVYIQADISKWEEARKLVDETIKIYGTVDILVNNAGLAVGLNALQEGIIDDWERMIDTNIKGLLYISRAITPIMINQGHGHIINIGSIAGKEVYPNGNVYCATKYAVDALSKSMRIDLVKHGIKVSQIAPGAVDTEFSEVRFKGDKDRAGKVYKGFEPLHAEDIAAIVYYVTTLPNHVNINDLVVMPTAQASATVYRKE